MGVTTAQRRIHLFNKYSPNLELWFPELKARYVCPICIDTAFTIVAVKGPHPVLTDEHSIPDGIGPPCHILTCGGCNSSAGSKIDTHLHKRLEWEGFGRGLHQEPLNLRMDIAGENVGIDVTRTAGKPNQVAIKIIAEQSDPRAIARLHEKMRSGPPGDLRMYFGKRVLPSMQMSKVAILKAAYLLAFRHFGYSYIITPNLHAVRHTIRNPTEPSVPLDDIMAEVPVDQTPPHIGLITVPEGLSGIVVPIPMKKYHRASVVIMPNDPGTYDRWTQYRKEHGESGIVKCRMKPIPFEESLLTERRYDWEPPGEQLGEDEISS